MGGSAQTVRIPQIAAYSSTACYSQHAADPFSFINNAAALNSLDHPAAGIYHEQRYLLRAFSHSMAAIVMPISLGTFGLQTMYNGYQLFNETQIGLGYGRSLSKSIDVGVKFNYYHFNMPTLATASTVYFEAGILLHLNEKLHAGLNIVNPVGGMLNKTVQEKIASVYRAGFGYELSEIFMLNAELIKIENQPLSVNTSFQYQPLKQFLIRAGIQTAGTVSLLGIGWKMGGFRFDLSATIHPQLGISPMVQLLFDLQQNSKQQE